MVFQVVGKGVDANTQVSKYFSRLIIISEVSLIHMHVK